MELAHIWLAIILMYNVGGNPNTPLYKTASTGPFESQEICVKNVQTIGVPMMLNMNKQQGYRIIDAYCIAVNEEDSVEAFIGSST